MRTHIDLLPDMLDFDRSAKPLYRQIEGILFDLIKRGILKKGAMLPPITEMAKSLGVDRLTVRRAIQSLEANQIVKSFRGRGKGIIVTYYSRTPPKMVLDTALKTILPHGDGSQIEVLDSVPCSSDSFELMEAAQKANSYQRIRRIHRKEGYLYGYYNLYIASNVYSLAPAGKIENNLAIRTVLGLVGKTNILSIYQNTTIGKASKDEAYWLNIAMDDPIARTQRVICNTSNVAIYVNNIIYPGDFFGLRVELGIE